MPEETSTDVDAEVAVEQQVDPAGDKPTGDVDEATDTVDVDDFDPDWARAEIKRLRSEAGKARTEAKRKAAEEATEAAEAKWRERLDAQAAEQAEWRKKVAVQLGLVDEEQPAELSPEQVLEKITAERDQERRLREEREAQFRDLSLEVAVQDAANMHGASAGKLTDSRRFMRTVRDLDPADPGFRVAVADAVAAAVEADKSLREDQKPRPPAVSGGTTVAGSRAKSVTDMGVDDFRAQLKGQRIN